jgi:hypothetical protein
MLGFLNMRSVNCPCLPYSDRNFWTLNYLPLIALRKLIALEKVCPSVRPMSSSLSLAFLQLRTQKWGNIIGSYDEGKQQWKNTLAG